MKNTEHRPHSTATGSTSTMPDISMHTVTPHLVCAGAAAAIEFYTKAFGAEEIMRLPTPDGKLIHASVRMGDSVVMLADEIPAMGCLGPKSLKGSPVTIHLQVDDADALHKRAVAAGATNVMEVQEMFWGDRYGIVEDPFGHRWSIAHHVREVGLTEMQKAAAAMCQ